MKKIHVPKMRFIVLKIIQISAILDTQTGSSDDCSGLTLFSSQRICQMLHKTEVSSACGYGLCFFACFLLLRVLATRWTQISGALSKWTHDDSGHDDYLCNSLLDDLVISSGTKLDVDNVVRGPDQQRSLDCFTHAMKDDSRMFPRNVLHADTIIVSCGLANFERIFWSMQRCQKHWELRGEPATTADYDKFLESFEDHHLGACDGCSV